MIKDKDRFFYSLNRLAKIFGIHPRNVLKRAELRGVNPLIIKGVHCRCSVFTKHQIELLK